MPLHRKEVLAYLRELHSEVQQEGLDNPEGELNDAVKGII